MDKKPVVMVDSEWEDCNHRIETANMLENITESLVRMCVVCEHVYVCICASVFALASLSHENVRNVQACFFKVVFNIKPLSDWMSSVEIA